MSNETDLDWLARNVHVWCLFCDAVAIVHDGEVTFHEPNKGLANAITIDQWVARRAELHGVTKQFKPSIEEANRLAQEFKPFISIEDNQDKDMKQDNGWFERGELPPAGVECEFRHPAFGWTGCDIVGHYRLSAVCAPDGGEFYGGRVGDFRPIRTDRELAIDEMMEHCKFMGSRDFAGSLFDAGYRKESR